MYCLRLENCLIDLDRHQCTGDNNGLAARINKLLQTHKIHTKKLDAHLYSFTLGPLIVKLKNSEIVEFLDTEVKEVGLNFLSGNTSLTDFYAPKLRKVGDWFLPCGDFDLHLLVKERTTLTNFTAPKLAQVGHGFMWYNNSITHLYLPELERVGNGFLEHNKSLVHLYAPKLRKAGDHFLEYHPRREQFLKMLNL